MIEKKYIDAMEVPESQNLNPWFVETAENFLKQKLAEDLKLYAIEVDRGKKELKPNTPLTMTIGLNEEGTEMEAFFCSNCSAGFAAKVKAELK